MACQWPGGRRGRCESRLRLETERDGASNVSMEAAQPLRGGTEESSAGSGSDFDTDQSRSVYLVRLISIWYCNWFMLFMSLDRDMPDEGTR